MSRRKPKADQDGNGRRTGRSAGGRSRLLDLLDERLRFESLLSRLSATFINLPADRVDDQIQRGLQQIVEFLGIERSTLAQFSEDGGELLVTHSYTVPGVAPFPQVNLAALLPWYTAQIRQGKLLRFTRLPEELPPEAVPEREVVVREGGPRSHLAIPFRVGDSVLGGIGFGSFGREVEWPDDLVACLRLVGEVFANALARKRADVALRESEGRFRLMADTAPVMVWMSGPDKRCTYVNKPWLDFTGRPPHRELGDGWSEDIHPDDVRRCLDTYGRAFDARQGFRMEYRLRRADGEYRWVLDTGVPRFESDGTFEGYIGSCLDVTDRKRAEEKETHLRDQLARVARVSLMGELAGSIAHEVNQPLCAIISNAQAVQRLLAGGSPDLAEVREAMEDIVRDGQRANAVIARTRDLLRKAPPQRAPADVNGLVGEVMVLVRHDLARRGVTVKLELADQLPKVFGDRVQLQQVLLNLLANGAEAAEHVGRTRRELVLRTAAGGDGSVAVAVQDAGVGIAPDHLGHVFDPFFTTKPGGLGMGLAICKSILKAHGGSIEVLPNPVHGTTFTVTLPAHREGTP
jgi:PAS domain S-box-containing protein